MCVRNLYVLTQRILIISKYRGDATDPNEKAPRLDQTYTRSFSFKHIEAGFILKETKSENSSKSQHCKENVGGKVGLLLALICHHFKNILHLVLLVAIGDILTFSDGSFRALRSSSSSSKIFSGLRGPFFTFESPLPSEFC